MIFDVVERPLLHEILFLGCKEVHQKVLEKELEKECKLKEGDALDPFVIEEARRHLEEFYHTKGFNGARVTLLEGDKPEDRRAIFVINEGTKKKVLWVDFVGNTIADDDRLRTQIKTSHPFLWLFKGEYDRKQLEEDKEKLTAYYRGLGFFHARIGVEPNDSDEGNWVTVTFVIDEGPRFKIRNVSVLGNSKYTSDELMADLKLKKGDYFNQAQMNADVNVDSGQVRQRGLRVCRHQARPAVPRRGGPTRPDLQDQGGRPLLRRQDQRQDQGRVPAHATRHGAESPFLQAGRHRGYPRNSRQRAAAARSQLFEANPAQGNAPKIAFSPPGSDSPGR